MQKITLRFPGINELLDFESVVSPKNIYNKSSFEISGNFTEADLELAL